MISQIEPLMYAGGIGLALLATICFNFAPLLMKLALNRMETISGKTFFKSLKAMFTSKKWLAGTVVNIIGGMMYFVALEITGVTVVQPILNVGLIVLALYARRMLGEMLNWKGKTGIGLLVIMPVFITFGSVSAPQALTRYDAIAAFSVACIIIVAVVGALSKKIPILMACMAGITLGFMSTCLQWFTLDFFAIINATGSLIKGFMAGFFPLFLTIALALVANLFIVQTGLQKNPAAIFNPVSGAINMITTVIGGILIFNQTIGNWWSYGIGIAIGIAGILLLSKYQLKVGQATSKPPVKQESTVKAPD
nr:DMT family transporter [Candidatus Sigynarchaeota archaeon]